MSKLLKKNKSETGQSMVELAVSFVVLMILLAGVVEIGRLAFYYISMRDAAQEGASFATIFPQNNFEVIERVKAGMSDQSRIKVVYGLGKQTEDVNNPISYYYKCYFNFELNEIQDEFTDMDCINYHDNRDGFNIEAIDIVEVIIYDPGFPVMMPFFANDIPLETTIRDYVISVPAN